MTWAAPGYDEVRELGAGGSGRVVLARHEATGTLVAVKYLSAEFVRDAGFRARFAQEAELLGEIASPHVARLYEYLEDEDGAAIVMQAVQGVTLHELIARGGPTGPEAALVVLKGSLLGLAAAHRLGVVHRDYKPANVLVGTEGASTLVDFGIALRSGAAAIVSGTPQYMAPEQWEGRPATPRTDIYAATATVVECLTGAPPFAVADVRALALAHRNAPLDLDALPGPVRALVGSGMAKDPAGRPATADEFVAALDEAARAAYGPGWEVEGRLHLAARVAALAFLLPLDGTDASATTTAGAGIREVAMSSPLDPGARWARRGRLALTGALVTVLVAAGSLVATSVGPEPTSTVTLASTTGGDPPDQEPGTSTAPGPATPEPPAPVPAPPDDGGSDGAPVAPPEVPADVPVQVTGVELASLTGEGGDLTGTVRVRTSGPGRVEVGFAYADGTTSGRTLSGSTSYDVPFAHAFAAGSDVCRVRITTTPPGPAGAVVGDRPCARATEPATVTSLNFAAVDYAEDGAVSGKLVVEADGPGPVTVRLDIGDRAETLSFDGKTRYVHRFHHPPVPCGKAFGFAASAPGVGVDGNLPARPCETEVEPAQPAVPAQPQQVAPPSEPPGETTVPGEPG